MRVTHTGVEMRLPTPAGSHSLPPRLNSDLFKNKDPQQRAPCLLPHSCTFLSLCWERYETSPFLRQLSQDQDQHEGKPSQIEGPNSTFPLRCPEMQRWVLGAQAQLDHFSPSSVTPIQFCQLPQSPMISEPIQQPSFIGTEGKT